MLEDLLMARIMVMKSNGGLHDTLWSRDSLEERGNHLVNYCRWETAPTSNDIRTTLIILSGDDWWTQL